MSIGDIYFFDEANETNLKHFFKNTQDNLFSCENTFSGNFDSKLILEFRA